MQTKRINLILWLSAAASGALALGSLFGSKYIHLGGEPYFPLYNFFWSIEPALTPINRLATAATIGLLGALFTLRISKNLKSKPTWTKLQKYNLLRTFSLIIAASPAAVLLPFGISGLISLLPESDLRNQTAGVFLVAAFGLMMPAAFAMIGLLVTNLIMLARRTTDPETSAPKLQQTLITLSIFAAAMPTISYLALISNAFKECVSNCNIFNEPILIPLSIAYVAIWLAIYLVGKRGKPTA